MMPLILVLISVIFPFSLTFKKCFWSIYFELNTTLSMEDYQVIKVLILKEFLISLQKCLLNIMLR